MYCKNCGSAVNETSQFCPNCGGNVGVVREQVIETNEIQHTIVPEFNLLYKFLESLWRAFLYLLMIWLCVIDLAALWMLVPSSLGITVVIIAVYIIVKMLIGKKQYENLRYNFYATKVEYIDGFLNKEEKELKYKYIREVTMTQNILERICGIGTIKIFTNASSGYGATRHTSMKGRNGVYIHCVNDVANEYRRIKQIIDSANVNEE